MSSAIWLVSVESGLATDAGMTGALPTTMRTAMVSPMARPMPSTTALTMPIFAAGSTTL